MLENQAGYPVSMFRYVIYFRVSTQRQGRSGLGLEAQHRLAYALVARNGGVIIAEYVEIESGKRADRPKLEEAIQHARLANATLLVAKLDRLARNAAFTLTLQRSGCAFVCADNEHATPLTIGVLALIAEHEAEQISARTKAALESAKCRGVKLGSARSGWAEAYGEARRKGAANGLPRARAARSEQTISYYAHLIPEITRRRDAGETYQTIADWLNGQGFRTRQHRRAFSPATVQQIYTREVARA